MNNTRIVVGDTDLDLPDNFSGIAQTLQGPNIGDLTTRAVNFTETITIPDTPTNQSVYEHANDPRSSTDVPYVKRSVKIIQNGIEVERNGIERLQSSGDGFSIYIQSGASLFFDTIGDKMLSDLTGFVVTTGDAENSARRAATTGVIYPVSYFGVNGGTDQYVGFPFVYDLSILNNIISDAGYIGQGSIFSNTKFSKTVTSAFSSEKGYVSSFIDLRRILVNVITPQALSVSSGSPTSLPVNFTGVSSSGTNPYGYWDGTNKYIVNDPRIPVDKQLFNIMFRININITVTGGTVNIILRQKAPSGNIDRTIATNVGSGTYSYDDNTAFNAGTNNGTSNYNQVYVIYNSGAGAVGVTVNAGTLQIEPAPNPLGYTFGFVVSPGSYYDDIAGLLPDIKQKDFIKDIMIEYGLIATENDGVITFTSFDEIIADRSNALNWTYKRSPDKIRDRITYTPFSYAQTNNFKYSNVDDLVSEYYGIGTFDISNSNIQETKDIYKSIYAASRTSFLGNVIAADVNLYDNSGVTFPNMFNKASNRKLLIRSKYSYEPSITYMNGSSYSDYKVAYFDDANQTYSMKLQQYIDDNYPLFIQSLQKAKVCNFYYMLYENDIAGFDFTKLVFDNDTYYLVNKIFNFIPGKLTQVQLFKV